MTHAEQVHAEIFENHVRERRHDIAEMLSTPGGRRIYASIIEMSGLFEAAPRSEPERAEWIGRRGLGLQLEQAFRADAPDLCNQAWDEWRTGRDEEVRRIHEAEKQDWSERKEWPFGKTKENKEKP